MRVLFDDHIFAIQRFGGISRYFSELVRCFAAIDVEVSLPFLFAQSEYLLSDRSLFKFRIFGGLDFPKKGRLTRLINRPLMEIALRRGRFDVFHATFTDRYYIDLLKGRPMVVTVHDMIPELFPKLFGRPERNHPYKREAVDAAAAVIVVSENTKRDLIRCYGADPAKIFRVYHGIACHEASKVSGRVKLPGHFILFVGHRWGYKNFRRFADAVGPILSSEPDLDVVCVGGGPLARDELEIFQRHDCVQRVHQHDLDDADLVRAYRAAELFVFPSHYEGFGMPILESFANGCPAVLAEASCFPEIAQDAALYFNPDDTEMMRDAIVRGLRDRDLRRRLRERGAKRAAEFSWERTAQQTRAVYRSLL